MTPQTERFYALDALRAVMMLLGIVLHSFVSFMTIKAWEYHDPVTSPVMNYLVFLIHDFRMPIFFVLAGFFSALLYERRGFIKFFRNRFFRIVVPFVVGLIIIWPLFQSGAIFSNLAKKVGLMAAFSDFSYTKSLLPEYTIHLWFLYYLVYFYMVGVLLTIACQRLPISLVDVFVCGFRAVLSQPILRVIVLSLLTSVLLWQLNGHLQTSTNFTLRVEILSVYFLFFAFGMLLYFQKDLLTVFKRYAWTQTIAGIAVFSIGYFWVLPQLSGDASEAIVRSLKTGFVIWLLFFGLTGLFSRYLNRPSPKTRYIVDASYWVYLISLPFCILIPGLLIETGFSASIKALIVLIGVTVITFTSYDFFVRSTLIGKMLNGKRFSRGLPVYSNTYKSTNNIG